MNNECQLASCRVLHNDVSICARHKRLLYIKYSYVHTIGTHYNETSLYAIFLLHSIFLLRVNDSYFKYATHKNIMSIHSL